MNRKWSLYLSLPVLVSLSDSIDKACASIEFNLDFMLSRHVISIRHEFTAVGVNVVVVVVVVIMIVCGPFQLIQIGSGEL